MFNADHGWVVGNGGEIHRTGKGGCYDPTVSLYADQTLCANQNYNLVADTFSTNYNSRYLWSTGSTLGNITVNSTANYSVTITNECGKTATDNALITFLRLLQVPVMMLQFVPVKAHSSVLLVELVIHGQIQVILMII